MKTPISIQIISLIDNLFRLEAYTVYFQNLFSKFVQEKNKIKAKNNTIINKTTTTKEEKKKKQINKNKINKGKNKTINKQIFIYNIVLIVYHFFPQIGVIFNSIDILIIYEHK